MGNLMYHQFVQISSLKMHKSLQFIAAATSRLKLMQL
jgi:hypothetical protein